MKKRIVCAMLAAMMTLSTGTAALAAENEVTDPAGGSIDVSTAVETPIYKVVVPTSMEFVIDPYELMGNGSSITSDDIQIINRSNVNVKVDMELTATAAEGVTLKDTAVGVTETDNSKLAYVVAQIPSAVTETEVSGKLDYNSGTYSIGNDGDKYEGLIFNDKVPGDKVTAAGETDLKKVTAVAGDYQTKAEVEFGSTAGKVLSFVLKKAKYLTTAEYENSVLTKGEEQVYYQAGAKGATAFRFSGKVNSQATWAETDLSASAVYSFIGMTDALYTSEVGDLESSTHALASTSEVQAATFTAGTKGVINYTPGSGSNAVASIVRVEMTNEGNVFDGYAACPWGEDWGAATNVGGVITLDTKFVEFFKANATTKATITYLTPSGATKTATVDVVTQ